MNGQPPQHRRNGTEGKEKHGFGSRLQSLGRGQRIGLVAGSVLVVAIVVVVLVAVLSSSTPKKGAGGATTTTTSAAGTTTTRPHPTLIAKNCPLTGLPSPGGRVLPRPALAVKIGNDPASRPQSGLEEADIVYEEMAEGGITRYMAVYQCQDAPVIGPVRSVRWDDWNILQNFGHPILAYSGGISYWMAEAATRPWIYNADGSIYPTANAYYRSTSDVLPASQGAPYNLYTSTSRLWAQFPQAKSPPPQLFKFSKALPAGATPDSSVSIPFSGESPVVWQWSATARKWLRFYNTSPDVDSSGHQIQATDVVIQMVTTRPGPYNESGPDSFDVESIITGTGKAYVLRDGSVETGTWSRPDGYAITKFTFPDGKPMRLRPGNIWYEVVPDYITVSLKS
ncbi:MAG: DUF3048 domain-containing protein [Acidimicrobiales bacterium]|jgi:hypothetical protein